MMNPPRKMVFNRFDYAAFTTLLYMLPDQWSCRCPGVAWPVNWDSRWKKAA